MRGVVAPCLLALLLGCGGDPSSPEERVRRVIGSLQSAAEAGDVSVFREHVSERYADERGNDKRGLVAYVTFHVMRNARRHVLVRIHAIDIREPGRAEVALAAGLAGSAAAGPAELDRLRADVYKVDLDLEEEGDGEWRLVWAQWRRTHAADLL